MNTDIEIAREAKLQPITEIAKKLGISEENIEVYGKYKAKISSYASKSYGKLVLVTAINPTPSGEGKTTMAIGLADGLSQIGHIACLALREPSLGPVFGIKGGAAGGGYSQVLPMEDINLHFTGDLHAITAANNLLAALVDNHIFNGNEQGIDKMIFKRCMDISDRSLSNIICNAGDGKSDTPHMSGFTITAASEIMSTLCLANDIADLKVRLSRIIVGFTADSKTVTVKDIGAEECLTILLKDAIKPNLVQTIEGTPAFIHGGPFANIAHGCNSLIATRAALELADYAVTEAGFGADLGAEKFFDIKCRTGGIKPDAVVLVATVRALKYNGGILKENLKNENIEALEKGIINLEAHIDNIKRVFYTPIVVCINHFYTDSDQEIEFIKDYCKGLGVKAVISYAFTKGGVGALELANAVVEEAEKHYQLGFCYEAEDDIKVKIDKVTKNIYGAEKVEYTEQAESDIREAEANGYGKLAICIAKTQFSLSPDKNLLGRPRGFTFLVTEVNIRAGSGFAVVQCGSVMLMPGLPKKPMALAMTIDENGIINGLS
ncbi:MAG: formate--tetrahydrofolate ligase [Clostridia bacterium]|nr:formate--tetrahydrofolate ligase [Clostridia bacterium]